MNFVRKSFDLFVFVAVIVVVVNVTIRLCLLWYDK